MESSERYEVCDEPSLHVAKACSFNNADARRSVWAAAAEQHVRCERDPFLAALDQFEEEVTRHFERLRIEYAGAIPKSPKSPKSSRAQNASPTQRRQARTASPLRESDVAMERGESSCSGVTYKTALTAGTILTSHTGASNARRTKTQQSRRVTLVEKDDDIAEMESIIAKSRKARIRSGNNVVKEKSCLQKLVLSVGFEVLFAALILLNLVVIAGECEYAGLELGFQVSYPRFIEPAETSFPWAVSFFQLVELIVGCAFTMEVTLKLSALTLDFFYSIWNVLDMIIILFWFVSLAENVIALNPMVLRLVRIVRLLRLVRLVRTFQMFDVLRLLVGSLLSSATVLFWSSVLLVLIMTVTALVLNFTLKEAIITNESALMSERKEMFKYFGSFSRSFLTMYELTFGNWVPVTRALHETSEWFCPLLLLYQLIVSFAVLNVIRAIFIHETMKVASLDEDLMIMERERQIRSHSSQMAVFLEEADTSGDGSLDFDEFVDVMADPRVKSWLSAMQVDVRDPAALFNLLDNWDGMSDSDGKLSIAELSNGIARLKGPARSMDLIMMLHEQRVSSDRLSNMIHSCEVMLGTCIGLRSAGVSESLGEHAENA